MESVSKGLLRKQSPKKASRKELLALSVDPFGSTSSRLRSLFLILNIMRIGKINSYGNPLSAGFSHSRVFLCSNEEQNIFFDRSVGRVPLDAAKYISDLITVFDMHSMGNVCLKSISFECLSVVLLVDDDDEELLSRVAHSLDDPHTKILEK
ncbi:hypothetical protein HAD_05705 [Hyphomonas adhaerens MHS-3]|uniref:Uncharacterized protein n=2 Tax=Hyphomonas adhaerens TaxID=81029 RepID=A0A069E526_9PROT|nr:hypothetical protein HAD_05705 [Hyphomonas adhaerens MHS-3]